MSSQADQLQFLGLMAAHEAAIAELYRTYAETLPTHREFFHCLADEEVDHARRVAAFTEQVRTGAVHVSPGRFTQQAILASLDYVRERMDEAQKASVSLGHALSVCADLENALIEQRFFEVMEGDEPKLRSLLDSLAAETSEHRERVGRARRGEG